MIVKINENSSKNLKSVWMENYLIKIINQSALPQKLEIKTYNDHMSTAYAIKSKEVNGPGTLKTIGAFALAQATYEAYLIPGLNTEFLNYHRWVKDAADHIKSQKFTEKSFTNSIDNILSQIQNLTPSDTVKETMKLAKQNAKNDETAYQNIGKQGFKIIKELSEKKGKQLNILIDSYGGWLSFVNHGSSHSPIYEAKSQGIDVKAYIETNMLQNENMRLTSWELQNANIEFETISNNDLMNNNLIDLILKNTGEEFHKTPNNIPFYVIASTLDEKIKNISNKNVNGIITENEILKLNPQQSLL